MDLESFKRITFQVKIICGQVDNGDISNVIIHRAFSHRMCNVNALLHLLFINSA